LKQGGNTFTAWPDDSLLQARGSAMRESPARFGTGRRRASGPRLLVHSSRGRAPASRRQANRDPRFSPFRRPPGGSASREHYAATFVQSSACCARPSTWRGSLGRFAIAPSSQALPVTGAAGLEPATPGFGGVVSSALLSRFRLLRAIVCASKQLLETFGVLFALSFYQMPVAVGHVGGGMADVVADPFERHAGGVHQRDVGVSRLV
jgi:hypothetical protein